jgi:hypothetical protein
MRRAVWLFLVVSLSGCRSDDIAKPEFRRPLEDLPSGAGSVWIANDLRNTYERAESHDIFTLVAQSETVRQVLQHADVKELLAACRAFEARTGTRVQDDLLLNAFGSRASLAVYGLGRHGADRSEPELLVVAELADPERFDRVLRELRPEDFQGDMEIASSTIGGRPALRLERADGRSIVVVRQENFLVASTEDSLALGALAIHAGETSESALREPAFAAALRAIGSHNIVVLSRTPEQADRWSAQGVTWDPTGLHVESVSAVALPEAAVAEPSHRDEILRSIPDGMTLVAYGRGSAFGLGAPASADSVAMGGTMVSPFSLPRMTGRMLPPEIWKVAGDEVGIGLLDVTSTPLAPIPNLGIVLELHDPKAATNILRMVEASLNAVRLQGRSHEFEEVQYGGKTFRSLVQPLSEALTPSWIVDGDLAIITTSRELMQQFIDTRRTGKRHALSDASFKPFGGFIPAEAWGVVYADRRRLNRVLEQVEPSVSRWPEAASLVADLRQFANLGQHFPAAAAYATREDDRLAVRGWVLEGN